MKLEHGKSGTIVFIKWRMITATNTGDLRHLLTSLFAELSGNA